MSHPRVVDKRCEEYDVYIGRPSKWGNPFSLRHEEERRVILDRYRGWLRRQPDLIRQAREALAGKVLGCWCAPRLCHGDVLAAVADGEEP